MVPLHYMKLILIHNRKIALKKGDFPNNDDADFPIPGKIAPRFTIGSEEYITHDPGEYLPAYDWIELRESWNILGEEKWIIAAKGAELLNFDSEFRFCRRCGGKLHDNSRISKICDKCGEEYFAPMNTAVMVLVTDKEDRALLVHARNFSRPFFGLVAGFVETGETLEECVAREVKEETNLDITDICYVESQSWPFPSQLMIGFRAKLAEGSAPLKFTDNELSEGGFFSREKLPQLAPQPSLARRLVEAWINSESLQHSDMFC